MTCKSCDIKKLQEGAQDLVDKAVSSVDKFGRSLDQAGAVLDEARWAVSDPGGYIRDRIVNGARDLIGDALESALGIHNICNTQSAKADFAAGDWRPYFGKRLWDSRGAAMVLGSVIPATSAAAVSEIYSELKGQYASAMNLLERAANDVGEDLTRVMERMMADLISSLMSGRIAYPSFDSQTFGLKATVLHVGCSNEAAGMRLPSEGYFMFAFAWRIKQPVMHAVGPTPGAAGTNCGCFTTYVNPVTHQPITCTCYFYRQSGAASCPGAQYGPSSRMYYRDC